MAEKQIKRLNYRHDAIMRWLLLNPEKPLSVCAAEMELSEGHLSVVINSDLFQAIYQAAAKEAGEIAAHSFANRAISIQSKIYDKIEERIDEDRFSERFLTDTSKHLADVLGFASKSSGNQNGNSEQHQHIHVHAETLEKAREKLMAVPKFIEAEVIS